MVPLLMLVLLLAIAFWVGKEFSYARRRSAFRATRDARGRPMLPPHERVTEQQVDERVRVLRGAVVGGDVTLDASAGSLIRFAGGAMTTDRARQLLTQ